MKNQRMCQSRQALAVRATSIATAIHAAMHMAVAGLALGALVAPAAAAEPVGDGKESRRYAIQPGPLGDVLARYAAAAGVQLAFDPALLAGQRSSGLNGRHGALEGFRQLLEGSGYEAVALGGDSYTLRKASHAADDHRMESTLPAIRVYAPKETNNQLMPTYAGGQIATGARAGLLGNMDFADAPFHITAYTSELIADQSARTLSDVLANDPSVRNATNRNTIDEKFLIRGLNLNTTDISFNGLYGISGSRRNTLHNIERVEILKGPNALLNGIAPFGSVGGAINLVPKRATDRPITSITAKYAADSTAESNLDIGRRFGPDDAFGVRANIAYADGKTAIDRQKEKTKAISLGMDYQGEKLRLSADFGYDNQENNAQPLQTAVAPGIDVPKAPRASRNYQQSWEYQKARHAYATVRAEYEISDNLMATLAFGKADNDEGSAYNKFTIADYAGAMTAPHEAFRRIYDTNVVEAGLRTHFDTGAVKHKISLTANDYSLKEKSNFFEPPFTIESNLYDPVQVAPAPSVSFSDLPKAGERNLRSLALADTLSFLDDQLQLTLAARHQSIRIDSFDRSIGTRTSRYDESDITPAVGLLIKPVRNVSLYANYIEGLSQGATAPTAGVSNPGEVFPPFKTKQYEIGSKVDFSSFGAAIALFQITQPSAFTNPTTSTFGIDGEQRNRGVEINIHGEALKNLRLLGGALLLNSKLTDTAGGVNNGNTSPGAPKVQFNMGAEWDTTFIPGLTLSGRVIHTSSQQVDNANTQSIPGWTRLDVGARYLTSWNGRALRLRANINNVFAKNYWESVPFAGNVVLGAPRTLLLSATLDF